MLFQGKELTLINIFLVRSSNLVVPDGKKLSTRLLWFLWFFTCISWGIPCFLFKSVIFLFPFLFPIASTMQSLQSFTWAFWGYLPSTDISCRPQFCHFLPSFLCCYLFSKWNIHLFILVFSDPTLFRLPFSVFYFPCLLHYIFLLCLSLHIFYFCFVFLVCLSYFFFHLFFSFGFAHVLHIF